MDKRVVDYVLRDYRRIVIENAKNNGWWYKSNDGKRVYWRDESKWNDMDNWNILQQTLEFELSLAKHVEAYSFVQKDDFIKCKSYEDYILHFQDYDGKADLMNGWWYCFKTLFKISNRSDDKGKNQILGDIKGKCEKEILGKNVEKRDSLKLLFKYLKVVYTIGNITPSPINPRADKWDSWEYKMDKYGDRFKKGYMNTLFFEDYINRKEEPFSDVNEYMKTRTNKIVSRGLRILGCYSKENRDEILKKL